MSRPQLSPVAGVGGVAETRCAAIFKAAPSENPSSSPPLPLLFPSSSPPPPPPPPREAVLMECLPNRIRHRIFKNHRGAFFRVIDSCQSCLNVSRALNYVRESRKNNTHSLTHLHTHTHTQRYTRKAARGLSFIAVFFPLLYP